MISLFSYLRKISTNPFVVTVLLMTLYWLDIISLHTLLCIIFAFFIAGLLLASATFFIVPSSNSKYSFFKVLTSFLLLDFLFNSSDQS